MAPLNRSSPRSRAAGKRPHESKPSSQPHSRQGSRLSIALFADGASQPEWLVRALAAIAGSDFADIVLVAVEQRRPARLPRLWRAYRRLDHWLFDQAGDPSAAADLNAAAAKAQHLVYARPPAGQAPAWRPVVAALPPIDVVFVVGGLDDADFEDIARYGVWRYRFGEAHGRREELAGWREVACGAPVTTAGLSVRLWPGVSRLIYQSSSRTNPFSLARNRANLLAKAEQFAARALRQLHRQGMARLRAPAAALPEPAPAADERPPGLWDTLGGLAWIGSRIVRRGWQKLTASEQWSIAFRFGPPCWDGNLEAFTHLQPPRDRSWADPFPCYRHGRYFIFFEDAPLAGGKGHLAVTEICADGSHSPPRKVLEAEHHLSYPFLIEDEGQLYLVPESGQQRCVALYRCQRFPDLWQRQKLLLAGVNCADATFFRDAERWWMFVAIGAEGSEPYDELHLFHAEALDGTWQPHPDNPVKSDVCSARPAGRLFMHQGLLHRPAQICAPRYGAGIAIARVQELTPQAYREEVAQLILPPPGQGILGLHTVNRSGNLNVIDCLARRRRI